MVRFRSMATMAMLAALLLAVPATGALASPQPSGDVGAMDTAWRCKTLSGSTNQLCLRIITDGLGNWKGVDTKYVKNQYANVTARLRWYSNTGQNGAGGWFSISAGQTRSHAFNGTNPRGCVHVALDVRGQGPYNGDPNAVYCS